MSNIGKTVEQLKAEFMASVSGAWDNMVGQVQKVLGDDVQTHISGMLGGVEPKVSISTLAAAAAATARKKPARRKTKARRKKAGPTKGIRPCIVPGCAKASKGPRFRFLCQDHKKLPKRTVKTYQDQHRANQAA